MRCLRPCNAILFLLLLSFPSFAQNDSPTYVRYDINNGLPCNNVYMCMQDHLGYMWFATEKGVVKYDGYEFKVFNTADGMSNEDVWKLQEDQKGRIWLYSLSEQFGYIKDDKYHDVHLPGAGRIYYPSRVANLKDGRSMFSFSIKDYDRKAICYMDDTSYTIKYFSSFIDNKVSFLYVADNGLLYAMTENEIYEVFFKGDSSTVKLKCADGNHHFLFGGDTYDGVGHRYIIFSRMKLSLLHFFDIAACKMYDLDLANIHNDPSEYYYVFFDDSTQMTVITNKHIYTIDNNRNIIGEERLENLPFKASQVSCRFKDRDDNVWYTSNSDGVLKKINNSPAIEKKSIPAGARYVGNAKNENYYWWEEKENMVYEVGPDEKLRKIKIPNLGLLRHVSGWDDNTICASFSKGMYLINTHEGKLKNLVNDKILTVTGYGEMNYYAERNLPAEQVKNHLFTNPNCTYRFRPNHLYTCNALAIDELLIVTPDSFRATKIREGRFADCFYEPEAKKIYAYNKEKILEVDVTTRKSRMLGDGVPGFPKRIFSVQRDKFHNIYILSENAVYRYNMPGHFFAEIPVNMSLSNAIMRVDEDNIMIGGKFGLAVAKLSPKGYPGTFSYYLNNNFYTQLTDVVLTKQGTLFLKTERGVMTTTVNDIFENGKRFDALRSMFRLVSKDSLYREINSGDTIPLEADRTYITLGGNNLYGKGNLKFDYRIKELDSNWKQATGEILINNTQTGRYYKMEVILKDDYWRSDPYSIIVYRKPYWYQTTTAKIVIWGGLAIVLVIIVLIVIYITRRYVAKANEKRQKLTDLELRAIHSQINPHFIFNTLSTALYFINRNEMEAAYTHVNKFSHLLRSYLKSSQERYISLDEEIEMLRRYIELQQSRFGDEFEFILSVDNKLPINHMKIPSLLLQPLVENAINHGLFHKKGKGQLKIDFKQGRSNDEMICTIEDNGVGRKAAGAINMANEFKRESYGSKLTQGLIDIFEQYEQMNIDISYVDKQAPETGTIVKLVIRNIKYETKQQG